MTEEERKEKVFPDYNINMLKPPRSAEPGSEIVISGISGIFPAAQDVHEFRDNLFNKVYIPTTNRWPGYENPELPARLGIITETNKFDAGFFGIHEREAVYLDSQIRHLEEKTLEAIFDAGLHPSDLENTNTGVYIGTCYNEQEQYVYWNNLGPKCNIWTGCENSMQAHRLSYFLKLKGPSIIVDSACSSSLYALENAFRALALGEIDNAIVGGSNICLHPYVTLQFSRLGVLSMNGVCKSFDKMGNGYVRSDAVGVLFLQKAKAANRIYAQVVHAKSNCDGYTELGLTYPSGEAQADMLKDFYEECNIDPNSVNYVEAHGTGTVVGDPEECFAIDEAIAKKRTTPLLLGSVKSNIGHTEATSGICSIIKCIIGMEAGFIPPNLHYNTPRHDISGIVEGRLKVVTEKMKFEDEGLAGVNNFGIGGANCHVLLRWNSKERSNVGLPEDTLPRLVCVSGRTENAVTSLLDELGDNELDVEHIKLLHNIFRINIQNHTYRGYTIVSKTGEISRSLKYFNGIKKPLHFTLGDLINWYEVGNDLMNLTAFTESIQRAEKILSDKGVNISNIFLNKKQDSEAYQILGSVVVQIGLIDIMKFLEIQPVSCKGYSFGILAASYYNGHITLEEIINCAWVMNKFLKGVNNGVRKENHVANNKMVNGDNNSNHTALEKLKFILKTDHSIKKHIEDRLATILGHQKSIPEKLLKSKFRVAEYFTKALLNNYSHYCERTDLHSIIFRIGQCPVQKYVEDIATISCFAPSEKRNCLVQLLESIGSLYEHGYNPQLDKIFPAIKLPVSRGTRMISPYIKWKHNRDWFVPEYHLDLSKQGHGTTTVTVQLEDTEWSFLSGHVIDGGNLFPVTGYLYLTWQTFASMYDLELSTMKVTFENCKFIRTITIDNTSSLLFEITIQRGTGNFEITESESLVVTGRIYQVEDSEIIIQNQPTISNNNSVALSLNTKEIYKELRLRGYNYKGDFCAIQTYDKSASKGLIKWNSNWTTFINNMLQMKILQSDTRLLCIPTYITKLTIDAGKHLEWINNEYGGEERSPDLPVFNDETTGIISCGDIHIWGLNTSPVIRKDILGDTPVLETHKFVPNIASLTIQESIRLNMQIIFENTLVYKVKVIEVIDDYSEQNIPLTPIILDVLEDEPLIQPCVKILSQIPLDVNVEVDNKELIFEKDCLLVIATNILRQPETLKEAFSALKGNGFILSREPRDFDMSITDSLNIEVITTHLTPTEYLILFRRRFPLRKSVTLQISYSKDFSWIPKLKEIINTHANQDIVIYSENEPNSGILGLINCLRKEQNGQNIRCVFIMDGDQEFDKNSSLYSTQLKKKMAVNVYKNGQWGTYRHLSLDGLQDVESEHCIVNVTVKDDLASVRWVEGPLRHDVVLNSEQKLAYVYYAALNFKDVRTTLGETDVDVISQARREKEYDQCFEFSGRDEKGYRVMGIVDHGAPSTMALVDSDFTFNVPDSWTLAEAATVPVSYLTAIYAVYIRGRMRHGDTILIHSGTEEISQAAIQLALSQCCTVFTTVATEDEREILKKTFPQLNDNHISSSGDELFEQMISKETNGRGVDIILNSLTEDKLLASIRCLARNGRFIETGKFDMTNNNELSLSILKINASFHGVTVDMLFKESLHTKLLLVKLMNEGIASGAIEPLNKTIFKFKEIEEAFKFMTCGRYMGKVLIEIREPETKTVSLPSIQKYRCCPRYYCDPEGVYVIAGGLGGVGLELADWLVHRGARKLVLNSRTGITNGYQDYRIRIWQTYGTIIKISKFDIASKSGCQNLIEESLELGSIHTIFNLAAVLHDPCIFQNQTSEKFYATFRPKALATQYLDEFSRKLCPNLRDFVVFSSLSCGRGIAGQTTYGMANSVVERICENRRRDGYPALTVQWGAVGDVGLIAEMKGDLIVGGSLQQKISSCLQVLDGFLKQKDEVILCSMVVAEKLEGIHDENNIVDSVAKALGFKVVKSVSVNATFAELGMDSITSVKIKYILERDFDITLDDKEIRNLTLARLKEMNEIRSTTDTVFD